MKKFQEFSSLQRKIINILSYCPITLTSVDNTDSFGHFKLTTASVWRIFFYIILNLNTFLKLVYLLFLVFGFFGEINFIDKICALLWILICLELLQELLFWIQKYPIFEVLANLWECENSIYIKLGQPKNLKQKCDLINMQTLVFHGGILVVGCFLLGLQFVFSPKYTVYTYAAFQHEDNILLLIFTCHEVAFMYNAWNGYLSIVTLSSVNAVELTGILSSLTKMIKTLKLSKPYKNTVLRGKLTTKDNEIHLKETKISMPKNPKVIYSEYLMDEIISDYKKLMLCSDLLNNFCSYRIIFIHTIGYCQFITDVFIMIQLLRLPEMDVSAVMWFGEDAIVCLLMMFRMFSLMSRVAPASEKFMRCLKEHFTTNPLNRKKYKKISRTMRLVCLKLGPCPVQPTTVGSAVMMLMNYYLCALLWK